VHVFYDLFSYIFKKSIEFIFEPRRLQFLGNVDLVGSMLNVFHIRKKLRITHQN
jgi:hypothetical protein